jgi:CheY-like chemotaxis protein
VVNEQPELLLPQGAMKVLLVDDNASNLQVMKEILTHFHIDAESASGPQEAIAKMKQARQKKEAFDLVITDHLMPGMDGITLVKELKRLFPANDHPYILMLSALDKDLYQREAAKAGINKFLSKPVKMHELYGALLSLSGVNLQQEGQSFVATGNNGVEKTSRSASIMVADDDPINMLLISEVLHRMGFEVIQVSNGKEALERLPHCDPVMIFMDVNMPEMDGYTTTRHIRLMPEPWCRLPIIALTADAMKGDREKCLEAGMNKYISKPFRLEEIDEVLRSYTLMV